METRILKCDCGCGAIAESDQDKVHWFGLFQNPNSQDSCEVKLDREFHFKSLSCLNNWAQKAQLIGSSLSKHAKIGPRPRETLRSDELPGVYV